MSDKVTVYHGTGSPPDPSPPGIVLGDYISPADVDAKITAALAALRYTTLWGASLNAVTGADQTIDFGPSALSSASAAPAWAFPTIGTRRIKRIRIKPFFNTLAAGNATLTLLKAGVATAYAFVIAHGDVSVQTIAADVDYADGDLLKLEGFTPNAGNATGQSALVAVEIEWQLVSP